MMTEEERHRFQDALVKLKNDVIDGLAKYDILVVWHTPEESPGAHFGPALLPFHRELLKQLEIALRQMDPTVGLPYWDSTLDEPLPDAADSILWSPLFMGNGDGEVTTGPFSNWTTIKDATMADLSPRRKIMRAIGQAQFGGLYKDIDIRTIRSKTQFKDLVFCIDPYFELVHGTVHMWVGGHMGELRISPNDPSFFMLHAFVDLLWEEFRENHQSAASRETEYTNQNESCSPFQYSDAVMRPFKIKNVDGLSDRYTDIFYQYSPRPTCSRANMDCGSPYLFCYEKNLSPFCISKVRLGGNCTGFEREDICYLGQCVSGQCVSLSATPRPTTTTTPPTTTRPPTRPTTPRRRETRPVARFPPRPRPTTPAPPSLPSTVWFPIMVLSIREGGIKEFRGARILSDHREPIGTRLNGEYASKSQVPTYTGAAYAQVVSPFANNGRSEATLKVVDETGRPCVALCLRGSTPPWTYAPCRARVILDADPRRSDDIPFTPFRKQAKYLNWRGEKKLPDPFLFVCHAEIVGDQLGGPVGPIRPRPQPRPRPPPILRPPPLPFSERRPNRTHFTRPGRPRVVELPSPWNTNPRSATGANNIVMSGRAFKDKKFSIDHKAQPADNQRADGAECLDYHSKCFEWAGRGNCDRNTNWMEENCRSSCGVCNRSIEELKPICGAAKTEGCINSDSRCDDWAAKGECQNNPWWMQENCPTSCSDCE